MSAANAWSIDVYFIGLILFVRRGEEITQALLQEARPGHHHHGQKYPTDSENCKHLVREDFEHHPLLQWEQGGNLGPRVHLDRIRLELRWVGGTAPINGAEQKKLSKVPKLPNLQDPTEMSSFSWVVRVEEVTPANAVDPACLKLRSPDHAIVAQVPIKGGIIETSDFSWVENDDGVFIPKLKFASGPDEASPLSRAAAEIVVWRPKIPTGATSLELWKVDLDREVEETKIKTFVKQDGAVKIEVTNQPNRRSECDIHPGRFPGIGGYHFEMFYSLLRAPTIPAMRRLPWAPEKLYLTSSLLRRKNVVKHPGHEVGPDAGGTGGGISRPVGALHRPLCVPVLGEEV